MTKTIIGGMILAMLVWATFAEAQTATRQPDGQAAAPGAAQLPAPFARFGASALPDWVKPGTRLTYYTATAIIRGSYEELVPDDHGQMFDDGKKYRRQEIPTAAAHGLSHVDAIAADDNGVAFLDRTFGITGVNGPLAAIAQTSYALTPGKSDMWFDPRELAKLKNTMTPGLLIGHGPYKAGDKTCNAVFIQNKSPAGSTLYIVDEESGLMLHYSAASIGAAPAIVEAGTTPQPGTMLAQRTLVSVRQLKLPWADAPMPTFRAGDVFQYDGVATFSMPNAGAMSYGAQYVLKIDKRGEHYFSTTVSLSTQMAPQPVLTTGVTAPGQIGALAIPPAILAKLQQGQELDSDPVSKIKLTVAFIGPGPAGRDIVALVETAGGQNPRTDLLYDKASGVLCGIIIGDPGNYTQIKYVLKPRGR